MNGEKQSSFPPISDRPLKFALGLFLILLTFLGFISEGLFSQVVSFFFAFLVGELRILGYVFMIGYGIALMLNKPFLKIEARLSTFGIMVTILTILGLSTLDVYLRNPDLPPLTLLSFVDSYFSVYFQNPEAIFQFESLRVGGGIFGYLVLAILNILNLVSLNQTFLLMGLFAGILMSLEKIWAYVIHSISMTMDQRQKEKQYFRRLSDHVPTKTMPGTFTTVDETSGQTKVVRDLFPGISVSGLSPVRFEKPTFTRPSTSSPTPNESFPSSPIEPSPIEEDTTESNASLYDAPDIELEVATPPPAPAKEVVPIKKPYHLPNLDFLTSRTSGLDYEFNERVTLRRKEILEQKFAALNVDATIVGYEIGPSVTSFDVQMADGAQTQQVKKVLLDLGVALGGYEVAFHDIVLGKTCSTIEVMNERASMVGYKEMLMDLRQNDQTQHKFMIPFGRNITGEVIAFTPKDMIHLLVAGSSGSGKTVFMHTFIMTILLQSTPDQARMLLIDPKKFELAKYKNLPHLLCPVITEMDEAKVALERLVDVMEERYLALQDSETSSLEQYNRYAEENGKPTFPLIFAIIDEYNDLINTHPQVSDLVARLAQKARAAGIHLMIATQRPTTDIITGSIKNNMATIVALRVAKQVDSVTVLGHAGAEILGGNGDMYLVNPLFARQGEIRVQGAYISEDEISRICASIRNAHLPSYDERFLNLKETPSSSPQDGFSSNMDYSDPLYETIKAVVMTMDYVSMNWIARTYEMGYPRALRLFKMLQNDGVVDASDTSPQNNKGRKVLIRVDEQGNGL